MEDFEKELKHGFLEEADQLISDVEQSYLELENNPSDMTIIDKIFRVAHNLKGSSRAVGFDNMGNFSHEFENLLLKIKEKSIEPTNSIVSLLLECNDHLRLMIKELREDMSANTNCDDLISKLQSALNGKLKDSPEATEQNSKGNSEIASFESTDNFNKQTLVDSSEESLIAEDVPPQILMPVSQLAPNTNTPTQGTPKKEVSSGNLTNEESIRVSLTRLEKLLNYVGEMVILQSVLKDQSQNMGTKVEKTVEQLGKVTKEIQEISMGLRMLPIKQMFQKMQRIVRDTSSNLNKKIKLVTEGEETELDKTILEKISDPLVHLIRNACDHGIEDPQKRIANNKSEYGTITLKAYHKSGKLVIEVADDGGGINPEILRAKAIEKKIISPTTQLSETETINLIFHPGFSTKTEVSDLSGRGVGMDVVKSNIISIQGEIYIETKVHQGTTIKIVLPLTLAIIDGLIVMSSGSRYVVPLAHVHESVKLEQSDIKHTTSMGDVLLLRGENIPLFYLNEILTKKVHSKNSTIDVDNSNSIAIIVRTNKEPFGIVVDDILGQSQIVIKKLGAELNHIKGISGSAILGDGRPSLILELAELILKNKGAAA